MHDWTTQVKQLKLKSILTSGVAFAALLSTAYSQIPAFPGAEGFGAYANGGRGGDVYTVVNLNSSGPGSLRYGVENAPASGRTIVFAVSGYIPINYNSDTGNQTVRIVRNNVTIAGQTAPGDGIGLKDGRILMTGNNCIIRHIRIRHGKYGGAGDCLNLESSAHDSIIDHVSLMFSTDENISFFSSSLDDFTMQYSTSSWGMERHNAGGLWDLQHGSCHHSLWAHHRTRNPKARPNGLLEWVNNVTFHWRNEGFIMGDSQTVTDWYANVLGCYYLSIADFDSSLKSVGLSKARIASDGEPNFHLYLDDCLFDANGDGQLNGTDLGYDIVDGEPYNPAEGAPAGTVRYDQSATPFTGAPAAITVDDPLTAYKKVISAAGALRLDAGYGGPLRDELDSLLIDSVENQESILVAKDSPVTTDPEEPPSNGEQHLADAYGISNNGFGTLNSGTAPEDSDGDGMPNDWELALGSNPAVQDHNTVFANNGSIITATTFFPPSTSAGYTYLEEYLHFCAVPHSRLAKNTAAQPSSLTVDLRRYTRGFTKSPDFTISGVYGGTFQQFATDGTTPSSTGPIVKFTPTQDSSGRAGFNFNVTDSDGSSWTQQFAILVTVSALPRDLVWIGGLNGNTWDAATLNWQNSASEPTAFSDGDNVLFDDRGNNANIPVSGTRTTESITMIGTKNYSFSGTGSLSAISTFTKASDSTLNLSTTLSTGSGTYLNGGETIINVGGNIAGGAIEFTGGSTLTDNTGTGYLTLAPDIKVSTGAVGNLNLSQRTDVNGSFSGGGTFNIYSPSTLGTEGRVYLNGASAGCTGTVNLMGGGTGRIAFKKNGGSFNGFDNARVHLDGISLYTADNSGGNTYAIGSLSGSANARIVGPYLGGAATWNVGGLGLDSEFAGTISDGLTAVNNLNKYGNGTLTLSGNNTYSGVTAIYAGTLHVLGSLGNTAVYVGGGARLSGSGPIGNLLTVQAGSEISPGDAPGEVGTMNTSGGVTLNEGTLYFDLSSNPASGNDQILNSSGTLTFNSPGAHFVFNLIDGYLSPGTYTLISGGSGTAASGSPILTHNLPTGGRQTFTLQRSGGGSTDAYVRLVVTGTAASLTWKGNNGSNWDTSTVNWLNGVSPDHYYDFDDVILDDTAVGGNINVVGGLQPRSMLVSNSALAYALGGGTLDGSMSLTKRGSGTLTINNTFAHTGGTTLEAGTVVLAANTSLGLSPVTLRGGNLAAASGDFGVPLVVDGSGTFIASTTPHTYVKAPIMGNGTLTIVPSGNIWTYEDDLAGFIGTVVLSGSGSLRLDQGGYVWGSPQCAFDLGSSATLNNRATSSAVTVYLGALSGGAGSTLQASQQSIGAGLTDTYIVGDLNLETTFSGSIVDGPSHALKLSKVGTGTLTLSGSSTYSGGTVVSTGALVVNNSSGSGTGSGAVLVQAGTTLGGNGSLGGNTTVEDGAILSPGTSTGTLTFNSDLTLNEFSILQFELGTSSDQIVVEGNLFAAGTIEVTDAGGFGPGTYTLFNWNTNQTLVLGTLTLGIVPPQFTYALSTDTPGQVDLIVTAPTSVNISEPIYALTTENQLISFNSIDPGTILTAHSVSGLQSGERIVGIDFWNDTLYGLGDMNHLYTLNVANGAAGLVGSFSPVLNGQAFGVDAEPGGLRVVSDLDQHLLLNYGTGTATIETMINGTPNPALTGLAYHPGNGQRVVADYAQNTIGLLNTGSGSVSTIGPAGIDFSRHNGFDISSNPGNTAYLASPAASSGSAANLYTVDLTTGTATLVGLIGLVGDNTLIRGLAVKPGYVELTSTELMMSVQGAQMILSWPENHTGWRLETQTNPIGVGLSTNWVDVDGATETNQIPIPISTDNGSVFYRLVYP